MNRDSDQSEEARRQNSDEHGKSRLSRFFVTDQTRAELLSWMVRALKHKRVAQRIDGQHTAVVLEHAWIFQFIDIIYVGTLFKISHLIGLCGRGATVYILCIAYFCIMYSTRLSFDVYTCVSGANGILHLIAFCFYGMGVFIMTVNISSHLQDGAAPHASLAAMLTPRRVTPYSSPLTESVSYGSCERSIDYDVAFAIAFIFTRIVLVTMYGLYFYVFHESNEIGHAPDLTNLGTNLRLSDITRDGDAEEVRQLQRSISITSTDRPMSVDHFRPDSNKSAVENPMLKAPAATNPITNRASFVMKFTKQYGENATKLHFTRIFVLKVAPVIVSSLAMTMMFYGVTPVVVLPAVAIIEIGGDFLPTFFVHHAADWRAMNPSRHFLEERLGLYFMLVLGEVVLGFSAINYFADSMEKIYKVLLFSFFSIFTVGMQYFEPLQSYTKPEGPHPLDIQQLNPIYVWLVCLVSFFMLIAGNGMVELYGQVAENSYIHLSSSDLRYQKEKVAIGLGSVTLLIILIKVLDKVYYRERLLPDAVFSWLDKFYKNTEEDQRRAQQSSGSGPARERQPSCDSDFGVPINPAGNVDSHSGNNGAVGLALQEQHSSNGHDGRVLRASSISSLQDGYNNRASFRVVPKSDLAMGIRRIRPITFLKVVISAVQYVLWQFDGIATQDYMTYNAALIVLPSLVEVILEVRNFFIQKKELQSKLPNLHQNHEGASI